MSKMRFHCLILACLLSLSTLAMAQQDKRPLTNQDVIKMVKAELPESTIILVIQKSPNKFDTSPDALITLNEAGATQKILNAILQEQNSQRGVVEDAPPTISTTAPPPGRTGGFNIGALTREPSINSTKLKSGIYKANPTETMIGGIFAGYEQMVSIKIKIESIDKEGNVKAELSRFNGGGRLKGKIDAKGKLQLEGIIVDQYEWEFTLTASVKDKALIEGKYRVVRGSVDTKGAFNIAVLEEDN